MPVAVDQYYYLGIVVVFQFFFFWFRFSATKKTHTHTHIHNNIFFLYPLQYSADINSTAMHDFAVKCSDSRLGFLLIFFCWCVCRGDCGERQEREGEMKKIQKEKEEEKRRKCKWGGGGGVKDGKWGVFYLLLHCGCCFFFFFAFYIRRIIFNKAIATWISS